MTTSVNDDSHKTPKPKLTDYIDTLPFNFVFNSIEVPQTKLTDSIDSHFTIPVNLDFRTTAQIDWSHWLCACIHSEVSLRYPHIRSEAPMLASLGLWGSCLQTIGPPMVESDIIFIGSNLFQWKFGASDGVRGYLRLTSECIHAQSHYFSQCELMKYPISSNKRYILVTPPGFCAQLFMTSLLRLTLVHL